MRKILTVGLAILIFALSGAAQEKEISIGAGDFYAEPVAVKRGSALRGRFQIKGDPDSETIEVYLMTAGNLKKWLAQKPAEFYFRSGRGTAGDFFIRARPGKYFLIINNRFSEAAGKTVTLTYF